MPRLSDAALDALIDLLTEAPTSPGTTTTLGSSPYTPITGHLSAGTGKVIRVASMTQQEKETESRLFHAYTGSTYRNYNRLLKYGTLPADAMDRASYSDREPGTTAALKGATFGGVQQLQKALLRGEVMSGLVLYRAAPTKEIGAVMRGQTIRWSGFVSASSSLPETLRFAEDQRGSFTSKKLWRLLLPAGSRARDVSRLSQTAEEQEILLPYGTMAKVVSVDKVVTSVRPPTRGPEWSWDTPLPLLTFETPSPQAQMGQKEWKTIQSIFNDLADLSGVERLSDFHVHTLVTAVVTTPTTFQAPTIPTRGGRR